MERLSSLSSQITSLENFVKIESKTAYNVLLICKPNQPQSYEILEKIFQSSKAQNLLIKVYVEKGFSQEDPQLFNERYSSDCDFFETESCEQQIDVVITYGGDGTILYTVNKFQKRTTPPILAISGGTLGFMCIYSLQEVEIQLNNLFQRLKQKIPIPIERKMRLQLAKFSPENEITEVKHAINEFVIERGALSACLRLQIFVENIPLTALQTDGLIINTPTGSTAYSLSAGGPIIYNDVKCMSVVPICPLSLSFRPLLLHPSQNLKVKVHPESRNEAKVVGDGQFTIQLLKNEEIVITSSNFDVLLINDQKNELNLQQYIVKLKKMLRWSSKFKPNFKS
ncbi:inorganic polyphosphate/ATP-NAD kinase (macronuclear) [Tetrahymena thermophila SB210]|uniref:Inorganic polyphosphate/ATP-NAD kinase n=1 Tax=Tetrahymena thermophila (strain SB210) TaxID=312017 RepID=Q23D92_TETTS|nr:inorganic polyphosphate/ATP-NAD kinase [Tetrahymena thermophila SB210]EAR94622.2 inorganic polyphosphate/ATP-NAD kinase [Tetrahymena thermophila SB210]|eukprot:XP_001014794.2 inorganic polyphosphate/ATP-NAD kinase [Tetrahymena thermophila SB210]